MKRFKPKAGGYGAFKMAEDETGEWVRHDEVDKLLLGVLPGKYAAIYRCACCKELFSDDEDPCISGNQSSIELYCQECWDECRDTAEESSHAYFDRYIAGDR